MAKVKKAPKPKATTPRGFKDDFGQAVHEKREMLNKLSALYELYGFDPLETSAIETVEALGKFLPDVDRPNEGVFAWQDDDESWIALRYDLTAPLARIAAQYQNSLHFPYRRYAMGPVWRNEKPGPGRFRQFTQCDADTVGSPLIAADAEIAILMARALEAVGIAPSDYIVKVNNRKVLNGVLEEAKLLLPNAPETHFETREIVLRTIDKFDRFGEAGVKALLGEGRKDDSGDFTKGAGLADEQIAMILGFVQATRASNHETVQALRALISTSDLGKKGIEELEEIAQCVAIENLSETQIKIDPSIVRGLGYYTGPVMEAELTFDIKDEKGRIRQFGSVAGGGRYDGLVKRFTGQDVPSVGMSIGVDRLLAALAMRKGQETRMQGPVIVTIMDRDHIQDYQKIVQKLREAGIRSELFLGNPKDFGKQLKYADARNAPIAIIQGSQERENGKLLVKDLILGAKLAQEISDRDEWAAQPAQEEIDEAQLIHYIQEKLAYDSPRTQ